MKIKIADFGKLPTFKPDPLRDVPLYDSGYNPRTATPKQRVAWFNALTCDPVEIPDCAGHYLNKFGQYFRLKAGQLRLIEVPITRGRRTIRIRRTDGTQTGGTTFSRLLYLTFIGELVTIAGTTFIVDHINDDSLQNAVFNLQLLTDSENRLKSKTKYTGVPRRRSGFVLITPVGDRTYYDSGPSAANAEHVNCKRVYDAADYRTPLSSGTRVERCARINQFYLSLPAAKTILRPSESVLAESYA